MNRLPKKGFLAAHPRCIFCAGRTKTEEPDHQPGQQMFDRNVWPEWYEFPACASCNRATANDEVLVNMFARFPHFLASEEKLEDFIERRFPDALKQFPDLYWAMRISENQRKRLQRFNGGRTGVVIRFPEEFRYRFNRVAFKLGAALHWMHADRQIIPEDGGCIVDIVTNQNEELSLQGDEFLRELANQRKNPVASRRSLSDQFEYDFWSHEEHIGLYSIRLRKHFRFIIGVVMNPSDFQAFASIPALSHKMVQPFDPAETTVPGYRQHRPPKGVYRWRVLAGADPNGSAPQ